LISGIEALAKILHPEFAARPEADGIVLPIATAAGTAVSSPVRAASA
jgi:hypothetical protein